MKNREIKFRAWDLDEKKMYLIDKLSDAEWVAYTSRHIQGKGNAVFQQYTGLKDKNGKEIYEGDILSDHPRWKWVVVWSDKDGGYTCRTAYADPKKSRPLYTNFKGQAKGEVIGNIYENPDILK